MARTGQDMGDGSVARLLGWAEQPPRAAHFIVTIYGDVVEPRGGTLWMGTLIEICDAVGLNESLVRTAVSRLVAAGQLIGERAGRRSYYRLTDRAQVDFEAAAGVLFSAWPDPKGFVFLAPRDSGAEPPRGFVTVGPDLLAGPDCPGQALPPGLAFRAEVFQGAEDLPSLAARYWDVQRHAAAYQRVLDRFGPIWAEVAAGAALSPRDSLVVRLLLVDDFREAILQDPGLPKGALPSDWPGHAARALFARLYLALSPQADSHVSREFRDAAGLLAAVTPQVHARQEALARLPVDPGRQKNTVIPEC